LKRATLSENFKSLALPSDFRRRYKESFMGVSDSSAISGNIAGKIGQPASDGKIEFQTLRDDAADLTQQIAGLLVATGEGTSDEVKRQVQRARQNINDLLTQAGEKSKDAFGAVRAGADPTIKGVEEAVHKHPFVVLALAVGLGVALGTLLRR
jgi:ElaB/YqjD/DUF883 family membrane-anchored ribosome-binding protein